MMYCDASRDKGIDACFVYLYLSIGLLLAFVFLLIFFSMMIIWPLNLAIVPMTFVHEMGHAIACEASGGHVVDFVVGMDGSGHISRNGGDNTLVSMSGALATAFVGALLLPIPYLRVFSVFFGYHGAMNMTDMQWSDGYWLFVGGYWWIALSVMVICIIVSMCAIFIMERNVVKYAEPSTSYTYNMRIIGMENARIV